MTFDAELLQIARPKSTGISEPADRSLFLVLEATYLCAMNS